MQTIYIIDHEYSGAKVVCIAAHAPDIRYTWAYHYVAAHLNAVIMDLGMTSSNCWQKLIATQIEKYIIM